MTESSSSTPGPQEPFGSPTEAADDSAGSESSAGAKAPFGLRAPEGRNGAEQTLLQQMGGVSGLAYSAVPVVVFVVVNSLFGMVAAIWIAIASSLAIAVARVVRREPLQPAVSGVLGVAVCSFIAYRTGDAKGFFLLGIWTSLLYGGGFLVSIAVRWPLVGVVWSVLNGHGFAWRHNRRALTGYDLATLSWTVVFLAKFVVQHWLYAADQTGWLAVARIAMGYPLTAVALLVTVWAIRRASKTVQQSSTADGKSSPGAETGRVAPESPATG
ncbi:DUF3159 domain-containing protein [Actinopolyspora mortivallis]|uniref:DUF3159 domain-containing protein n=1 Tax=Actinopolyspora mortivallis TaxID=33906 RepID=A0A2T0H136_ACTMO|nr:DUF3159 domain-containing protein [Actinopolyspora mortivallis]PRW65062.1 DUF3159 domain-containing protein [Actinopolyspora mortivallis]